MHRGGWKQDYKAQTLVYPRSQNIEAWMVKTMSAGCVNTVVAEKIDLHADQKQEIKFVWPDGDIEMDVVHVVAMKYIVCVPSELISASV